MCLIFVLNQFDQIIVDFSGENIFSLLDNEIGGLGHEVGWTNCVALGCDNAPVMVGKHTGVYGLIKEKHSKIFLSGCSLHIVHNAAKKAAGELPPLRGSTGGHILLLSEEFQPPASIQE